MKINRLSIKTIYKKPLIKAKITNVKGSAPNKVNDLMFITPKQIFGTIGGGNLEYLVIKESISMLKNEINKEFNNKEKKPSFVIFFSSCFFLASI